MMRRILEPLAAHAHIPTRSPSRSLSKSSLIPRSSSPVGAMLQVFHLLSSSYSSSSRIDLCTTRLVLRMYTPPLFSLDIINSAGELIWATGVRRHLSGHVEHLLFLDITSGVERRLSASMCRGAQQLLHVRAWRAQALSTCITQ